MTALTDIRAAIALRRDVDPERSLVVTVGRAAQQALFAEMDVRALPPEIDAVPVRSTEDFPGWQVDGQ
jgi:hypothetical protein